MTNLDSDRPGPRMWRTFEPGETTGMATRWTDENTAALKHGAWSERKISPVAAEMLTAVLDMAESDPQFEHLRTPMFRPALRAWVRCEARIERLATWLDDKQSETSPGDIDADEELRPAAQLLLRLEGQALKHRAQLGVDPASLARLRRDAGSALVSFDLASLLAELVPGGSPDGERDADDAHEHTDG